MRLGKGRCALARVGVWVTASQIEPSPVREATPRMATQETPNAAACIQQTTA